MNAKNVGTACLFLLSLLVSGQDFQTQFRDALQKEDTAKQEEILKSWKAKSPNDAERYVSLFNYHVNKGRSEMLSLSTQQQSKETLVFKDSAGTDAGFIGSKVNYDPDEVNLAIEAINAGIVQHLKRLDMRFGKIYLLGETENYQDYASEIIKAIDYGKTKQDWLWKEGKPLQDSERFFLENVQGYVGTIYNTGNDDLLRLMREIAEAVLKYYPNSVENLSNVSITYLLVSDFDKALPFLLKAEKINPQDVIVLNNIAETYKRSGNIPEAKIYYEKVIKHGDEKDQAHAREQLNGLR